jgi:hypothetical protein
MAAIYIMATVINMAMITVGSSGSQASSRLHLMRSSAGSIASIVEPGGPTGCCQSCGRLKRAQPATEVPNIKLGIRRQGHRVRWNVNEGIVGQVRFPKHSPAGADCKEITNKADIERPIGGEIQLTTSVRGTTGERFHR